MTALFPSSRPRINVKVLPRFPSRMVGQTGIDVQVVGGVSTTRLAIDELTLNNSTNPTNRSVLSYNSDSGEHERTPMSALAEIISGPVTPLLDYASQSETRAGADVDKPVKPPEAVDLIDFKRPIGLRSAFLSTSLSAAVKEVNTNGWSVPGDFGKAAHKRISGPPPYNGGFRSADRFLPDGTTDNTNGGYHQIAEPEVTPQMFGVGDPDSASDDAAMQDWLRYICDGHAKGYVPCGVYRMASGITAPLNASVKIRVDANAQFVVQSGFPQGPRVILITTGTGGDFSFEWIGGSFDATNQPNSGPGESCDIFSFNAENCISCNIELDHTVSGTDWLNSGSDSHLFVGGARNIRAGIRDCNGAKDAGVYISASFDTNIGSSLVGFGNYTKCAVGYIVKRLFKMVNVDISAVDCLTGGGIGTADTTGGTIITGARGIYFKVNSLRTERTVALQCAESANVVAQAIDIGVSIPGYTSTMAMAIYASGSKYTLGSAVVQNVNAACTSNTSFNAVFCDTRNINSTDHYATDNMFFITATGIGKAMREVDANQDRNHYNIVESSVLTNSVLTGANSSLQQHNRQTGYGEEIDAPAVSLGGRRGAEGVRVLRTASSVNFLQLLGSTAGASAGVQVQAQGTDTNVPISIVPKASAGVTIGGIGGAESLRITKATSTGSANAVEVTGAAASSAPSILARGSDTNIDLTVGGKGTGRLKTSYASAAAATPANFSAARYLEIKDSSGTTYYIPLATATW